MTEDRMLRAFSELDMPAMPDPAFASRLYASLAAELGLKPATSAGTVVVPVHAVEGTGRTRARVQFRRRRALLTLLAAALLLLALMAGALLIAGQLRPLTPLETVERSRAAYVQAPAVQFVITDDMGVTTVTGDGRGTWRSTSWDMAPESYMLYDGTRVGVYDATTRVWDVHPVQNGGPSFPFNTHFAWTQMSYPDLVATMTPVECADATAAPPRTIAGREAQGITCPKVKMTYWVDTETGLVLRAEAAFGSPYWNGALVDPASGDAQDETPTVIEVGTFDALDSVDPTAFDWNGPRMPVRSGSIPGTKLVIGDPPPAWTGTDIDGETVTLPASGGPVAVLLWGSWCPGALDAIAAFDEAIGRTGVRGVVIAANDAGGTVLGLRSQHPWTVQTAVDPAGLFANSWGLTGLPELVLLDADGRVAEIAHGDPGRTDVEATLASLAAGVPAVVPAAASNATPAQVTPQVTCDTATHVVCAEPGDRMRAWSGVTADGSRMSTSSLLGRPAVLWLDSPAMCDGPCPDLAKDLAAGMGALADASGGRAAIVLIASGEMEPGGTQALLDEVGAMLDVVYDWDGSIYRSIAQQTNGAIVIDADGRIVQQWVGAFEPADVRAAMESLLASPAP